MLRFFSALLVLTALIAGLFFLRDHDLSLKSPIPKVYGTSQLAKKNSPINKWFPNKIALSTSNLNISARSAILVDYDTQEVIFEKNSTQQLPVASTVKIMTALVALENAKLQDVFEVSQKAAAIGENSMGLTAGEKLTLEELLYGLMLVSGNDAAVAIAEGIAQTEAQFVEIMNQKIKDLGLTDSLFINASGLEEDNVLQYSTARDLAVITHYALENYPEFEKITSTVNKFLEANDTHKAFDLYNDTNLLTTYPGVRGVKPGFTWEAGLCLVTYARNENKKLIGVVLGSDDRRGEMKELLDYGFAHFGIPISHPALDL